MTSFAPAFNPTAERRLQGRSVVRLPGQLRLHHALLEIGWTGMMDELNDAARLKNQRMNEPILITPNGTILAGFGRWQLAIVEGRHEIHCIEYAVDEDESLNFILSHYQSRHGWNPFVRIRLALTQEPALQQRALEILRSGGKHKGSANLPEAQRIDVRQAVATLAGVGCRNVSNVKTILQVAHPRIIGALTNGCLKIHRAMQFCKLARAEQLEQFTRYITERATNKTINMSLSLPVAGTIGAEPIAVLDALRKQESAEPGSVAMRLAREKQTVVLIGRDLLAQPLPRKERKLV